jgi:hypothetical protein
VVQIPSKIFVGGLPGEVHSEELRVYFERYGQVADAIVMWDRQTNRSRGFGYVTFRDLAAATAARAEGDARRVTFYGKVVEIKESVARDDSGGGGGGGGRRGGGGGGGRGGGRGGGGGFAGGAPPGAAGAWAGSYPAAPPPAAAAPAPWTGAAPWAGSYPAAAPAPPQWGAALGGWGMPVAPAVGAPPGAYYPSPQ